MEWCIRFAIAIAVLVVTAGPGLAETTWVVDADGAGNTSDCDDPTPTFSTVSAAIAAAADGDTVLVCPGIYLESIDFQGKAITVRSKAGPGLTIIDGTQIGPKASPVVTCASGEGPDAVLSGFTLRTGDAFALSHTGAGRSGVGAKDWFRALATGVEVHRSSPTITGNVIVDNGGGIEVISGSPMIQGNIIASNGAGGIHIVELVRGDGNPLTAAPQILDNYIVRNDGPGISGNGSPIITGNVMFGNRTDDPGTRVVTTGGDLAISALSDPPREAAVRGTLVLTETVTNQGSSSTGVSLTRYYLSPDRHRDGHDRRLIGHRWVFPLAPGGQSTGTTTVTIPPRLPLGSYYVLACADYGRDVAEEREDNNCLASETAVEIAERLESDLVVVDVSDAPGSIAAGRVFSVTVTVENQGTLAIGPVKFVHLLASDTRRYGLDGRGNGRRWMMPPMLPAGATSAQTAVLFVPPSAVPDDYYLEICAAGTWIARESGDKTNNCWRSATPVTVTPCTGACDEE